MERRFSVAKRMKNRKLYGKLLNFILFQQTDIILTNRRNCMKENLSLKSIAQKTASQPKHNHHASVLNGMQYLTEQHVVKKCRETDYECFVNINKKEIFSLVHCFVNKLLDSEEFLDKILKDTKFDENHLEATIFQNSTEKTKKPVLEEMDLENSLNKISMDIKDNSFMKGEQDFKLKVQKKRKSYKKISIMLPEGFNEFQNYSIGSSSLFSDQSLSGISSVNITNQQLTLEMVERIYQQPQPFLINLSVCLMLKFLFCSNTKLTPRNVCWILSIGTIVAYKIYYDEQVSGLVESFANILKVNKEDIITLERNFLTEINHQTVISNEQYHLTLFQIIKQGHQ